jgi:hypothetical protein
MDTRQSFVGAVWRDTAIHDEHGAQTAQTVVWSKPDMVSESFELRRLTTT